MRSLSLFGADVDVIITTWTSLYMSTNDVEVIVYTWYVSVTVDARRQVASITGWVSYSNTSARGADAWTGAHSAQRHSTLDQLLPAQRPVSNMQFLVIVVIVFFQIRTPTTTFAENGLFCMFYTHMYCILCCAFYDIAIVNIYRHYFKLSSLCTCINLACLCTSQFVSIHLWFDRGKYFRTTTKEWVLIFTVICAWC